VQANIFSAVRIYDEAKRNFTVDGPEGIFSAFLRHNEGTARGTSVDPNSSEHSKKCAFEYPISVSASTIAKI
jgi:hypothetical protein